MLLPSSNSYSYSYSFSFSTTTALLFSRPPTARSSSGGGGGGSGGYPPAISIRCLNWNRSVLSAVPLPLTVRALHCLPPPVPSALSGHNGRRRRRGSPQAGHRGMARGSGIAAATPEDRHFVPRPTCSNGARSQQPLSPTAQCGVAGRQQAGRQTDSVRD